MRPMSIGDTIQAWRLARGVSVASLAKKAGVGIATVESIEAGKTDPPITVVADIAKALDVPTPWLFDDPKHMELCFDDSDADGTGALPIDSADPVTQHMLRAVRHDRTLFVLLTALIQGGDPKLLRAAEMSLRSLVKQSRQATVPWQNRPPGHFEPRSD